MVQLVLQNCCKGSRLKSFVSHFTTQNNMICSLLFRHSCNGGYLKFNLSLLQRSVQCCKTICTFLFPVLFYLEDLEPFSKTFFTVLSVSSNNAVFYLSLVHVQCVVLGPRKFPMPLVRVFSENDKIFRQEKKYVE